MLLSWRGMYISTKRRPKSKTTLLKVSWYKHRLDSCVFFNTVNNIKKSMSYNIVSILFDKSRHSSHNLNELHIRISNEDAEKLGFITSPNTKPYGKFFGVLYHSEYEMFFKHKHKLNGLFITLFIAKNLPSNSDTLNLFATVAFFEHYNFRVGMKFSCSIVRPITMERVTLGAKSLEVYKWAKNDNWQNDILNYQNESMLCRNGDTLQLNLSAIEKIENFSLIYDLVVLECGPVCQGLITNDTSITIMKLTNEVLKRRTNRNVKSIDERKKSTTIDTYLNLMNFTSRILMSNHGCIYNKSNSLDITNKNVIPIIKSLATSNAALKVLRNAKPLHVEIMPKLTNLKLLHEDTDIHNSVYVNTADLTTTGIEKDKNNWVYIKLKHPDTDEIDDIDRDCGNWRLVKIYSVPTVFPIGSAQVTPQLWFNLNQHPSPLLQDSELLFKPACSDPMIVYAKEVYLALIQSPNYSSSQNFDILLKSHFETTRYLKVGDVIALCLAGDGKICQISSDFNTDSSWDPTIYFYVSRIEPPDERHFLDKNICFKIDTINSRLYQSGTKESYVPVTMETFNRKDPFHRLWDAPTLPGSMGRVRDKLFSIINPFLKSKQLRNHVSTNILLSGPVGSGKKLALKAVCRSLNLHFYSVDCQEVVGDAAGATEMRLRNCAAKALKYAPAIFHLNNISLLSREKKDASASNGEDPRTISSFGQILAILSGPECESSWPLITVATTNAIVGVTKSGKGDSLHPDLASLFTHHIGLETPNEEERISILEFLLPLEIPYSISISKLAHKTAGFVLSDLNELISVSTWKAFKRVTNYLLKNNVETDENEIALAGVAIEQMDIDLALEKLQNVKAQSIGAPKIPNVRWDDVGGLEAVKKEILNTIQLPLNHPELVHSGLKRSGVLLYGAPGTGKTLLAKAVATECSLNFLSVKGPELINMYVGQSEENVREVFHRARSASPCVIFFDELDSLAPNRGLSGDSGGVMDRVVSQLLAELDGINQTTANIFVIGATNRPDLLDPALLRPGRFDRLVELGVAKTSQERLNILKALTRKMPMSKDINLAEIEKVSPEGLTGADFYSLCSDAQTKALERCINMLEEGKEEEGNLKPEITMEDFVSSLKTLIPSVSN